jgi:hypothetical protein
LKDVDVDFSELGKGKEENEAQKEHNKYGRALSTN